MLYLFGLDGYLNDASQDYIDYKPDTSKSLQEIAGYANRPEINDVLKSLHRQLKECVEKHRASVTGSEYSILELGCGPGLYLQDFNSSGYKLTGIDVSNEMCSLARKNVPAADIIHGHFLKHEFNTTFDCIYSIGVLMYFSKGQVKRVFDKMHALLNKNGIIFISYPHAFRKKDLTYHDFTYVHYSPSFLEKLVTEKFTVLHHLHQDQQKKVTDYDRTPYINPENYDNRSYVNNYIIILQKK
ncbi:MAG: class I SAM-dependent methyltransferase [Bacteroidia bacterium]